MQTIEHYSESIKIMKKMILKIAIFQKNDRNFVGKIMHCAMVG